MLGAIYALLEQDLKNWEDDKDDILSRFTHKQGALGGLWRWL